MSIAELQLYDEVVEYVDNETGFDKKSDVPDVDLESTCFVSYEKGYVLQVRPEPEDVTVEYGLGLAKPETESGITYIRTVDCLGETSIESLEEAKSFLGGISSVKENM